MLKLMKNTDFAVGLILSCLSIWYIKVATSIRLGASHPVDIGPRTMPLIYGSILLVLSILLMIKSFMEDRVDNGNQEPTLLLPSLLSILVTVVYYLVLPKLGFIISSTLLLLCMTRVLSDKKRNWWLLLVIYLSFVVAISLIFGRWFLVHFPEPLFESWRM